MTRKAAAILVASAVTTAVDVRYFGCPGIRE
jgi:hypothetical protein